MKTLVINIETWPNNINANLQYLKHNVKQLINNSISYKKTI